MRRSPEDERSGASCSTASATWSRSRCFFAIGLQAVASAAWLVRMAVGALLAVIAIAIVLVLARLYSARRRNRRGIERARAVVTVLRETVVMLGQPIGRHRAATWLGLSACTWILSAVASTLVGRALGIDLSPLEAVFVTSALALGVAIPSSPGYIGTYQWIGVAALGLLDVPVEQALAFSILMQATWYVPTTLVGGAFVGLRAIRGRPVREADPSRSEGDDLERRYSHRDDLGRRSAAERGALARDAVRGDREPRSSRWTTTSRSCSSTTARPTEAWRSSAGSTTRPTNVVVVHLRRNFGKAAALQAGFLEARGDLVVTIDADLQDDPAEIPKLLAKLDEGFDLVSGWKTRRNDPFTRRLFSRVFNWVTGVDLGRHAARHQLRAEGVPRRGAAGHASVRGAAPLHPGARRLPRIPDRGDPGEPPRAPARTVSLRSRALPPRLLRPAQRHVHGPLPPPAAASVRRHRPRHGRGRLRRSSRTSR